MTDRTFRCIGWFVYGFLILLGVPTMGLILIGTSAIFLAMLGCLSGLG